MPARRERNVDTAVTGHDRHRAEPQPDLERRSTGLGRVGIEVGERDVRREAVLAPRPMPASDSDDTTLMRSSASPGTSTAA